MTTGHVRRFLISNFFVMCSLCFLDSAIIMDTIIVIIIGIVYLYKTKTTGKNYRNRLMNCYAHHHGKLYCMIISRSCLASITQMEVLFLEYIERKEINNTRRQRWRTDWMPSNSVWTFVNKFIAHLLIPFLSRSSNSGVLVYIIYRTVLLRFAVRYRYSDSR